MNPGRTDISVYHRLFLRIVVKNLSGSVFQEEKKRAHVKQEKVQRPGSRRLCEQSFNYVSTAHIICSTHEEK